MCLVHREVSLTGFIRAVSICTCSYLQLDCSYTYRCICQRIWEKSRKIIAEYDVEVVTQISLPSWCFLSQSRENVSSSLLDVLACSIAVSFFSLFVFPPPPRAPQNAAQLLNILSKTIFQNHLIRWNNNIRKYKKYQNFPSESPIIWGSCKRPWPLLGLGVLKFFIVLNLLLATTCFAVGCM